MGHGSYIQNQTNKKYSHWSSIKHSNKPNYMCIHNASLFSALNLQGIFFLTTHIHLEKSCYGFAIEKQQPYLLCSIQFPTNQCHHCCQNHVSPFRFRMTVLRQQWLYETIHHRVQRIDFATVILNPLHPSTLTKGLRQLPTEFLPKHNMTAHISGLLYVSGLIYRTVHGTFFYLRPTSWNNIAMKIVKTKEELLFFDTKSCSRYQVQLRLLPDYIPLAHSPARWI